MLVRSTSGVVPDKQTGSLCFTSVNEPELPKTYMSRFLASTLPSLFKLKYLGTVIDLTHGFNYQEQEVCTPTKTFVHTCKKIGNSRS